MHTLKRYGVAGTMFNWIEQYLTEWGLKVALDGFLHHLILFLGVQYLPIFILLHIIDISKVNSKSLVNSIRLFVDDRNVYATVTDELVI